MIFQSNSGRETTNDNFNVMGEYFLPCVLDK